MVKEVWRLLIDGSIDPSANLAIEEAIARTVGAGRAPKTLRLWRNRNAVVIGRYQDPSLEVDFKACSRFGTKIVRRFTGGGAVYHDLGNLNYSIAVPRSREFADMNLRETAEYFARGMIEAVALLGARPELVPPYQIRVNGRKVSGSALSIRWGSVLHHGSLLIDTDLQILYEVLNPTVEAGDTLSRYVRSARVEVTNLNLEIDRKISLDEAKDAVIWGFTKSLGVGLMRGSLTGYERQLAELLYEMKYTTDGWNMRGVAPPDLL